MIVLDRSARLARRRDDDGSALIETVFVIVVLLVPLVWVATALLRVEAGAYAVRAAARQAARTYVTASSSGQGAGRAQLASDLAFTDQKAPVGTTVITCTTSPCLVPGGTVTARSRTTVPLPFVPSWLAGAAHLQVTVTSQHTEKVEEYGGER